ncbi:hypothetical protein A3G55_00955 [Candidatus Giovannonibacteria bacterium RIFCSPLOWO2_12_FULL_44_25]|uniref:Uncharacterized protein n=1 Tax=Candidatus Giovannonibacteria bacterium GW2011_GWA1_44_25 TaxID=1618645 RepID=A0A0G1IMX6_9BACT|nr:MAG: hypothetical protein UW15_C0008G0015 [Parcubacteria group bacterium GW2011_GWC1_44_10]KKT60283.1 MAG: hypothetical protein UW53_C0002G0035 [Candidatus Giovannonibacteria bacterium GW2011_GWA1_44_25]KKU29689.1 MAG: hypothetical protein UX43_C0007G0031 [Candidatus Giovannonibacteria bacterium GW2011_GWB1_46_20]OGF48990.1 MAG: hypothetical protein A2120_00655 [Candidatus Giovannonibacteria bacterium GWA2_45_15]OGF60413.1 MAG: hypothetical protein A2W40_00115 [Candidatus Giovannonibacteria 
MLVLVVWAGTGLLIGGWMLYLLINSVKNPQTCVWCHKPIRFWHKKQKTFDKLFYHCESCVTKKSTRGA